MSVSQQNNKNQQETNSPTMGSRKSSGTSHSPYAHSVLRSCDQFTGSVQQCQMQQLAQQQQQRSGHNSAGHSSGSSSSHSGSDHGEFSALPQPNGAPPTHNGVRHRANSSATNNSVKSYTSGAAPPPPPSYVQATVNAAREWTTTPPSESDQHATPPHTPELDSGNQSTITNGTNNNSGNYRQHPTVASVNNAPEGAYHAPLFGQCEWIQPPPVPLIDQPTPAFPCYRLFLGQIRFETTPAEVKWIVEYITGVQALKVETRGIGCFLAYFQSYDDMIATQQLHKRVLFDHTGIWFARTDEQAMAMQDYVRQALGRIGRGFRLPKDMMVVEEEKLQRALPIPSAPPQYHGSNGSGPSGNQQHQQQGPSYSSFAGNHNGNNSRGGNNNNNNGGSGRFPQHQYNNSQQQYNSQHSQGGYSSNNGGYHGGGNNGTPFPSHQYTHHSQQNGGHQQVGYSSIPDYQQQQY